MRGSNRIVSSVILSMAVCGAAMGAPGAPAKVPAVADCQQLGSEVSALIDTKTASPNIAPARSAFQIGIMECMEGNDAAANKHYEQAQALLTGVAPKPPVTPAKPPVVAPPAAITADCQQVGGEVSALIDAKVASPNIASARSAFQVGIMECVEGDDAAANKHYEQAKTLLSSDLPRAPAHR